mmetsp:Transcript_33134/g.91560  ORF Transcript_33134/g.91560 Transcript_33134/m.91560 type:complete len:228 (+) Transcript_33134:932-1615(+)
MLLGAPAVRQGDDRDVSCLYKVHELVHLPYGAWITSLQLLAPRDHAPTAEALEEPGALDEDCVTPCEHFPDGAVGHVLVRRHCRKRLRRHIEGTLPGWVLEPLGVHARAAACGVDGLFRLFADHRFDVALHLLTPTVSKCLATGASTIFGLQSLQLRQQLGRNVRYTPPATLAALAHQLFLLLADCAPVVPHPTARWCLTCPLAQDGPEFGPLRGDPVHWQAIPCDV